MGLRFEISRQGLRLRTLGRRARALALPIEQAAERSLGCDRGSRILDMLNCAPNTYHRTTRGLLIEAICDDQLLSFADQCLGKNQETFRCISSTMQHTDMNLS